MLDFIKEVYSKIKKPRDAITSIFIFRPLSVPFVVIFSKLNLTPNFVSLLSFVFGIFSAIFFLEGNLLFGLIFFNLYYLFDVVDGGLARFTNESSKLGLFVDTALGEPPLMIMYFSVSFFFYNYYNDLLIIFQMLVFFGLMALYHNLNYAFAVSRDKEYAHNKENFVRHLSNRISIIGRFSSLGVVPTLFDTCDFTVAFFNFVPLAHLLYKVNYFDIFMFIYNAFLLVLLILKYFVYTRYILLYQRESELG